MFLQKAYPPDAKGMLKGIVDQKEPLTKIYDETTQSAIDWFSRDASLKFDRAVFSQSITLIAAWPTPLALWVAPAAVSVFPCGDGSVAVTAYALNQRAFQLGHNSVESTLASEHHKKKDEFEAVSDCYIHVHIRVFPATSCCSKGRDEMRKYPPFYEVSVTCMNVVRIRSWFTTTQAIIGDWMRSYWLGEKSWNGHSMEKMNARRQQVILWNDTGHTRRACALSSNNFKRLKNRCWISSSGTVIQGNKNTIIEVSTSHDQFAHSLLARSRENQHIYFCKRSLLDRRLPL